MQYSRERRLLLPFGVVLINLLIITLISNPLFIHTSQLLYSQLPQNSQIVFSTIISALDVVSI
jgi:type II secretory pathway component PulM